MPTTLLTLRVSDRLALPKSCKRTMRATGSSATGDPDTSPVVRYVTTESGAPTAEAWASTTIHPSGAKPEADRPGMALLADWRAVVDNFMPPHRAVDRIGEFEGPL